MTRILLRVILFLFSLEIFLRISGFVSLAVQDYQNQSHFKGQQAYTILCVGESVTMGGDNPYPRQLEEILNQKNFSNKFQVINKGVAGLTTETIVASVPEWLKEYKPNMVIAMMGINDESNKPFMVQALGRSTFFTGLTRFFYGLRVCKLGRGIYKDLKINLNQFFHHSDIEKEKTDEKPRRDTIYDEVPDYGQGLSDDNTRKVFQLAVMSLLMKDYVDAEKLFRFLTENPNSKLYNSKTTFIHYLAESLYQQSKAQDLILALKKLPYREWYDIPVIDFCSDQVNAGHIITSLKDLTQEFPEISFYADMISQCYEKSGKGKEADIWKRRALTMKEDQVNTDTKLNYLKLVDILHKNGATTVLMQYPLRNVGSLKGMVQSVSNDEEIIFVDNEDMFKEAVRKEGYQAIFLDYYAGDFGHLTPRGCQILAENAAKTILKTMIWK